MEENFSFGYWLRRQRLARDMRQADLAQQLGVAAITLRKIEADERRPSLQLIGRIAEVFALGQEEHAALLQVARADLSPAALPLPERAHETGRPAEARPPETLPSGTLTFLFTDIAGSTELWERHPDDMRAALARHDALLRAAVAEHGGAVVKGTGDGLIAAFPLAEDALAAALAGQRAMVAAEWGETGPLRVRMALHSGAAELQGQDYFGPTLNRAARLLAAGHGGQILLSRATAELLRDQLPATVRLRELGEHRLKDLTRPEQIVQVEAPDLPSDFPPLRTLDTQRHNLPAQATALIGREAEVAAVCALLRQADTRLVTLTGPGGTGKTRLALQAAAELSERFAQGVWFVNLAPVRDPALVLPAIAQTLGVREAGGRPLGETLRGALRDQELLLLLDNVEQVIAAAPDLAALLSAGPRVKALVTSREALHISGEHRFAVPPLALPDPQALAVGGAAPPDAVSQYEAVRLFIERAQAVRPGFAVTSTNAPAVAAICARLDGLPLAIELAAARVNLFTPEALLQRLERGLPLLTGGPRDRPARHQTLQGAIEWSYTLLSAEEQGLFRQLAVFSGGCRFDAVAAVARLDELDLLNLLGALVDKSLLRQTDGPDGEPRFGMLETLREYGLGLLGQSGELEATREAHAAYFLALAERAEPELRGTAALLWQELLTTDHANLRAALRSFEARGDIESVARLCYGLWRFWHDRGMWSEGHQFLAPLLREEVLMRLSPRLQARSMFCAGIFLARLSTFAQARDLLERSRHLFGALGEPGEKADALFGLAIVTHSASDYRATEAIMREAEECSRAAGDRYRTAISLSYRAYVTNILGEAEAAWGMAQESLAIFRELGINEQVGVQLSELGFQAYGRGNLGQAAAYLEEAIPILRATGGRYELSSAINYLAQVVKDQGDLARAVPLYREALALRRGLGDRRGSVAVLVGLAEVLQAVGDHAGGHAQLREALETSRDLGYLQGYVWGVRAAAYLAVGDGDPRRAATLLGAEAALLERHQIPIWPEELPLYERALSQIRAALGAGAFDAAWEEGRAMELGAALALAGGAG